MINKHLILSLLALLLVACSEKSIQTTFTEAQLSIKEINTALLNEQKVDEVKYLPFSEAYLKDRHLILKNVAFTSLTAEQQSELQYLIIQERYPERYLPWPAITNVAKHLNSAQKAAWQKLVVSKLKEAQESKIFYNRYELEQLIDYSKSDNLDDLQAYLEGYKPRSRLGLYQLPNGKEWYQSKINYYYSAVEKPITLLAKIQKVSSEQKTNSTILENFDLIEVAKQNCKIEAGLNWIEQYINLPATFKNCDMSKLSKYRKSVLVLAEVDLGIHYQAWSEQQALVTLVQKLEIDNIQAKALLTDIIFKPAAVLAAARPFLLDN
ncbi:hypothetical protein [Pseudoalteromonas phenolica]|uniref:hypothetical protein n=1 Tax=Pseudoalteromonas phenolica TaxID=161398 RepID=UPI00384E1E2A